MPSDFIDEFEQLALLNKFGSFRIPSSLDQIFQELRFSKFELALARSVLQIECTARPYEVRLLELFLAFTAVIKSIVSFTEFAAAYFAFLFCRRMNVIQPTSAAVAALKATGLKKPPSIMLSRTAQPPSHTPHELPTNQSLSFT